MSYQVMESSSFVELSTEEQQLLSGGCKDCGGKKYQYHRHHHHHHHVHEFRYPKKETKDCYDNDSD
jgi:predicted  nucleic acid-binding Zn-ribbon protein